MITPLILLDSGDEIKGERENRTVLNEKPPSQVFHAIITGLMGKCGFVRREETSSFNDSHADYNKFFLFPS